MQMVVRSEIILVQRRCCLTESNCVVMLPLLIISDENPEPSVAVAVT